MPLSNCVRFSYTLISGVFFMMSASKSRRSNSVALHSLQSLISTLIVLADFSAGGFDTAKVSSVNIRVIGIHTRINAQWDIAGTPCYRVTAYNPPASSTMVSSERVTAKLLLTKRTLGHAGVILPGDNCLLDSLPLIALPGHRPPFVCIGLDLFQRQGSQQLGESGQPFFQSRDFQSGLIDSLFPHVLEGVGPIPHQT